MRMFPWWFWFVVAGVQFWFVTAPAAIALLSFGYSGAAWLGGWRWVALGAGTLLALPFPLSAAMYAVQAVDAERYWRKLDRAETIDGVELPPGSRIRFADKAHTALISVDLPRVTEIRQADALRNVGRCRSGVGRHARRRPDCERHPLPCRLFHLRQVWHNL
jgi:hypothetical protein